MTLTQAASIEVYYSNHWRNYGIFMYPSFVKANKVLLSFSISPSYSSARGYIQEGLNDIYTLI